MTETLGLVNRPPAVAPDEREGTGAVPTHPIRETGDDRLLNRVSALRDRVDHLRDGTTQLHQDVRDYDLSERTSATALRDPREMLAELTDDYGLAWSEVAALTGVTDAAVRKWRRGQSLTPESRRSLARSLTFMHVVQEVAGPIADVGSWLGMPLADRSSVTPLQLYCAGLVTPLIDHVAGKLPANQLLDAYDPDWRASRDDGWKVTEGPDGDLTIVAPE